ncbi:MAG: MFS transporter, partial [Acidimicrobiales bacterium]
AGMTVSLVLGVPLGALVGSLGSWRWTFGLVAAIAAAAAVGIAGLLPRIPPVRASSLRVRLALLRQTPVAAILGAAFLWSTGAFVAYTFVVPVLEAATGWHGAAISVLLLLYGAAAFAGNAAGGLAADRWGAKGSVITALGSLIVSLSALGLAVRLGPPAGTPVAIGALIAWAAAGWSLTPAQSHRLVGLAPAAGPEVLSLNTSAVYLGIAAGAAAGGQILTHLGTAPIALAAAALQLLALIVVAGVRPAPTRPRATAAAMAPDSP